jgi:hypothetical protein
MWYCFALTFCRINKAIVTIRARSESRCNLFRQAPSGARTRFRQAPSGARTRYASAVKGHLRCSNRFWTRPAIFGSQY